MSVMSSAEKSYVKSQLAEALNVLEECTDDYIFIFDLINDYYSISKRALDVYDLPDEAFINASEHIMKIVHPDDRDMLSEDLAQIKNGEKDVHNLEYRWLDRDGKITWISCRGKIVDSEGKIFVGRVTRLDRKRKADNLTGFLAESMLKTNYNKRMSVETDFKGFFLIIGLDNLKEINQNYGMVGGDKAITIVSNAIKNCVQETTNIYRMEGDEFVVCIAGTTAQAKKVYRQIRSKIDELILANDYELFFTISAGIVEVTSDMPYDDVKIKMEFALNSAKKQGKNCVVIYDEESYAEYRKLLDIQEILRNSINNSFEGYEVYYQPIIDVVSGKLIGAEALLRYQCEKYGRLSPAQFIPILEESGLIIPVGRWVAYTAIKQCKEWQKILPEFKININLSYIQIKKSNVTQDILSLIETIGIEAKYITFEFTESVYIEDDIIVKKLIQTFNEEGIKLALDDFGTGYSNLAYLQDLNVDVIKIDRSFVNKAMQDENIYGVINHIIDIAHSMDLTVCIEGIENEEERSKIAKLLPDTMQGYLYGRPVDADMFMHDNIEKAIS